MCYESLFMWIYKGEPGCPSSISVSLGATRDPRLNVSGLQMERRKTLLPPAPAPPSIPATSSALRLLRRREGLY